MDVLCLRAPMCVCETHSHQTLVPHYCLPQTNRNFPFAVMCWCSLWYPTSWIRPHLFPHILSLTVEFKMFASQFVVHAAVVRVYACVRCMFMHIARSVHTGLCVGGWVCMRAVFGHEQEIFSKTLLPHNAKQNVLTEHTTDHHTVYATRYDKRHYSTIDWSSNQSARTGFLTCVAASSRCCCGGSSARTRLNTPGNILGHRSVRLLVPRSSYPNRWPENKNANKYCRCRTWNGWNYSRTCEGNTTLIIWYCLHLRARACVCVWEFFSSKLPIGCKNKADVMSNYHRVMILRMGKVIVGSHSTRV